MKAKVGLICMVELMLQWAQKNVTDLSLVIAVLPVNTSALRFFSLASYVSDDENDMRKIQRVGAII